MLVFNASNLKTKCQKLVLTVGFYRCVKLVLTCGLHIRLSAVRVRDNQIRLVLFIPIEIFAKST